jgi:tetratricopeptide (TPR) repeat protein
MGAVKQPVASIVDLGAAERAFLLSAKYAESRAQAAAMGLRCAGWAAYCRGNLEDAVGYSRKAVQYNPKSAEAHFQLAKTYIHMGRTEEATRPLRNAICLDPIYAVKSAIDGDFKMYPEALERIFELIRKELGEESERFDNGFELAERRFGIIAQCNKALSFHISAKEKQQLETILNSRKEAAAQAQTNTIFGHSLAIGYSRNAVGLHGLVDRLRKRAFAAFHRNMQPLYEIVKRKRADLDLNEALRGYRIWILLLGYVPWMFFWLCATPSKIPQFLGGSLAVVGWAIVVYAGLPIVCAILELLWFVPRVIMDAVWEETIGRPARTRLKELESLKEGLERAFA